MSSDSIRDELIQFFWPRGHWGGWNQFFAPALSSKLMDQGMRALRCALNTGVIEPAIAFFTSSHFKFPQTGPVECFPTGKAKVAIELLTALKTDSAYASRDNVIKSLQEKLKEQAHLLGVLKVWQAAKDSGYHPDRIKAFTFREDFLDADQTRANVKAGLRHQMKPYTADKYHNAARLRTGELVPINLVERP